MANGNRTGRYAIIGNFRAKDKEEICNQFLNRYLNNGNESIVRNPEANFYKAILLANKIEKTDKYSIVLEMAYHFKYEEEYGITIYFKTEKYNH